METEYDGPERRAEAKDYVARQRIDTHERECALRYAGIKQEYAHTNQALTELKAQHTQTQIELRNFMKLVFLSVIGFFVSLAIAFGAAAWNTRDRFTGNDAKSMKAELQREIQSLRKENKDLNEFILRQRNKR